MAYDDKRFYCVNTEMIYGGPRQAIRARSLEDGSAVWSRPLRAQESRASRRISHGRWLTRRYVIAYPDHNPPAAEDIDKLPVTTMPVILRQRETGELVQRFVFSTTIADLTLNADPRGDLCGDRTWPLGIGLERGKLRAACPTAGAEATLRSPPHGKRPVLDAVDWCFFAILSTSPLNI